MRIRVPVGVCIALVAACVAVQPARAEPFPAHRRQVATSSTTWRLPAVRLDQGDRDTCGIFAALQQLNMVGGPLISQRVAERVSDAAQAAPVSATYGSRDVLRDVLARYGYPVTYRPVTGGVDGLLAALRSGPVEVDVPYLSGMAQTDPGGRWRTVGTFTWLSHGVVAYAYDPVRGRLWILNQWGDGFGVHGTAWMTVADLRRLAADHPGFYSVTAWTRTTRGGRP